MTIKEKQMSDFNDVEWFDNVEEMSQGTPFK